MEFNAGRLTTLIQEHAPWRGKAASRPLPTVLIVDDEESVRHFVERVLSAEGYTTVVTSSGAEALEAAGKLAACDLVVTDLMMPLMRGDQLAGHLRQSEPALKVLYLTGFSDRLFKEKVVLWEDEAFLDKPTSVDGLSEAVSLLLYGHTHGPRGEALSKS